MSTQTLIKCDWCKQSLNIGAGGWLLQDDGSYIHVDCIEPALKAYQESLDNLDFKLLSKIDPREPFAEGWRETCEWCGHITDSPSETHVCKEKI